MKMFWMVMGSIFSGLTGLFLGDALVSQSRQDHDLLCAYGLGAMIVLCIIASWITEERERKANAEIRRAAERVRDVLQPVLDEVKAEGPEPFSVTVRFVGDGSVNICTTAKDVHAKEISDLLASAAYELNNVRTKNAEAAKNPHSE